MLRLFNWIGTRFSVGAAWHFLSWGLPLAALLVGAGGGAWAAWQLGRAPLRMENAALREDAAQLRTSYAEASRLAAMATARRLQVAQARGDELGQRLANALTQNDQLKLEKTHALARVATDRVCFSSPVLGVLDGAPGLGLAGGQRLPTPTGEPAATHAAPAAAADADHPRGPHATEADMAAWTLAVGAQYEACRERLGALIDWHAPSASTPPAGGAGE